MGIGKPLYEKRCGGEEKPAQPDGDKPDDKLIQKDLRTQLFETTVEIIGSVILACDDHTCSEPDDPEDKQQVLETLACMTGIELEAQSGPQCQQILQPLLDIVATTGSQMANRMVQKIRDSCSDVPCDLTLDTPEALDEVLKCFSELDISSLSDTCRPVLEPLLKTAAPPRPQISEDQANAALMKFRSIASFCPKVRCNLYPETPAEKEVTLQCMGGISLKNLSEECISALRNGPPAPPPVSRPSVSIPQSSFPGSSLPGSSLPDRVNAPISPGFGGRRRPIG